MSWFEASARWYGTLLLLTWAFAPLVRLLCVRLAETGITIARPLALLGVVYPLWLLASLKLLPYSTAGLWITAAVGATLGWGLAGRQRLITLTWLRSLVFVETLSLLLFVGYVWLRGYTPQIQNTEKPMDAAFLASSARAMTMPPNDPWFSGEPINYYYLGYLLHGSLARMASVPATVGFNLALATTFSMAAVAAGGLAYNVARTALRLRRALVAGLLAGAFIVLLGNLYAPVKLLEDPGKTYRADWWNGIGWNASRIVCDIPDDCHGLGETINEFPFFSFLLGDLHPHLTALPYTLLALALALNLALLARGRRSPRLVGTEWLRIGVTGAAIGSLYALNSWDFPTYLVVGLVALYIGVGPKSTPDRWRALSLMVIASLVTWVPFWVTFVPFAGGDASTLPAALRHVPGAAKFFTTVTWYRGERTSVGEFLTIFGVPYVVSLWFLGTKMTDPGVRLWSDRLQRLILRSSIVYVILAVFVPIPLLLVCGVPLTVAVLLLRQDHSLGPRTVATALYAAGFALIILTEFFYIEDVFHRRMNTLFKVYYQVWTLFAVATALAVVVLWRERRPRQFARPVLACVLLLAVAAGLVYPIIASYRWTNEFARWDGLDGITYVGAEAPDELAAIRWLSSHARTDDIMLQGTGCGYSPASRVAALTGIPTLIGWSNHEGQWRSGEPALSAEIGRRQEDVRNMYRDPSSPLFDRYHVTLLYIGRYEREDASLACEADNPYLETVSPSYPGPGWQPVYHKGDVSIYRRIARESADRFQMG